MKDKKVLIIAGVLVFAVAVGAYLLAGGKNKTSVKIDDGTSIEVKTDEGGSLKMTLSEIVAQNVPQKCSLEYSDGEMTTTSETWIKGGKYKQFMEVSAPESGKRSVYTISDSEYIYTWEDGASTGNKVKIEQTEDVEAESAETESEEASVELQMNDAFDYKCAPAAISDSEFDIPSDVAFTDINAELEKLQEQVQDLNMEDFMQNLPQE